MKFFWLWFGVVCIVLVLFLLEMCVLLSSGMLCWGQNGWVSSRFFSVVLVVWLCVIIFCMLQWCSVCLVRVVVIISQWCLLVCVGFLISVYWILVFSDIVSEVGSVYGVVVQIGMVILILVGRLMLKCVVSCVGLCVMQVMLIVGEVLFWYLILVLVSVELQLKYQCIGLVLCMMWLLVNILDSVWILLVLKLKFSVLYGLFQLLIMFRCLKLWCCSLICFLVNLWYFWWNCMVLSLVLILFYFFLIVILIGRLWQFQFGMQGVLKLVRQCDLMMMFLRILLIVWFRWIWLLVQGGLLCSMNSG